MIRWSLEWKSESGCTWLDVVSDDGQFRIEEGYGDETKPYSLVRRGRWVSDHSSVDAAKRAAAEVPHAVSDLR